MEGPYSLWDKLKVVPAYNFSYQLSGQIYDFCQTLKNNRDFWPIMDQLVRSADSVSANIAEGYGRYFYKDKIRFYYQARGSLLEVCDWLAKSYNRNFIGQEQNQKFKKRIDMIFKEIEILIFHTKKQVNIEK